ncbi:MAG: DUF4097 family beta strand repeat-containing protein [Blastocatellia bacterium]
MAEPCKSCGSELFAGQRFCRACGNPIDTLDAGEAPTQQFADGTGPSPGEATTRHMSPPDDWGARNATHTAPQSRPNTNPVGRPPDTYQTPPAYQTPPTSYQMPPQPPAWQSAQYAPQAAPTRSGSSWAIVLAVILALMLGAMMAGRAIYKNIRGRIPPSQQLGAPAADDMKVFPLAKGATVAFRTVNGSITVTGSDAPQAEVRILASGGANPSDVTIRSDNNGLSISAPAKGKISFEVKLPRELGVASFTSTNGSVSLSDVGGQLTVETTNGKIKLDQVSGIDRAKSTTGGIEATLRQSANPRPITLETTNGGIDLEFQDDFNGTLDASTMRGGIKVDESYDDIKIDKKFPMGAQASGNIGSGGPTVTVKTMNGGIKINK